jgi:hypothetical protein
VGLWASLRSEPSAYPGAGEQQEKQPALAGYAVSLADWLVVSVMVHYVAIGLLYFHQQGSWMLLGLYTCYSGANAFLIALAVQAAKLSKI